MGRFTNVRSPLLSLLNRFLYSSLSTLSVFQMLPAVDLLWVIGSATEPYPRHRLGRFLARRQQLYLGGV